MSLLSQYQLNYERLEDEKIWRTKTGQREFKADQGARYRNLVGALVSRLTRNSNQSVKANNK